MKLKSNYLLLFLPLFLLTVNCKDKENEADILPNATETGARTGGAIINGKTWVAKKKKNYIPGMNNDYSVKGDSTFIQLRLENVSDNSNLMIKVGFLNSEVNNTHILNGSMSKERNFAMYYNSDNAFSTVANDTEYTGKIKFTKFDFYNLTLSGTFEFKALSLSGSGQVIDVKEGRFDQKFHE
ncbi:MULTISPECIES: DUF6252 family protein [Chryseobacterium]|uniref:DUF6252 family protein n=1 Tax=Chryseobacterium TaxID=59732 RepID=UPI00195D273F|nr:MULTISPECIES: DUF6252 family protein [Chryseobacterium]MBM7419844.1 hypothetical protein [Chryseobacterium sp. JUb44]MDH6209781.1 hypothetical protein [Chryseobacterium sp. BIGb0186]WSO08523.1 DUF6252 family protein [Chryseobacterium scophthalmum]